MNDIITTANAGKSALEWPYQILNRVDYESILMETTLRKIEKNPFCVLSVDPTFPYWDTCSLANYLGISVELLDVISSEICSSIVGKHCYSTFYISKDTGKIVKFNECTRVRVIEAPCEALKRIQLKLAESFLALPQHPANYAFVKGKNIKEAASSAANSDLLIHVDLKDFFTSHNEWYVYSKLLKILRDKIDTKAITGVARMLSHICCKDHHLPQGSPASPLLTVVLNYDLDVRIQTLADKFHLTYARFADDLLFSGNIDDMEGRKFIDELVNAVHPFSINYKKLCFMRNRSYSSFRGLKISYLNPSYLPSSQSAKIVSIANSIIRELVPEYTADRPQGVLVKSKYILVNFNGLKLSKEVTSQFVKKLNDVLSTKYPKISFTVRPIYFYIQTFKQALGLHVVNESPNYPNKLYRHLRVLAMLAGIQKALYVAHKILKKCSRYKLIFSNVLAGVAIPFDANGNVLPKRNLVKNPISVKSFNGKVSYIKSVDPKKGAALVKIVDKHFIKTLKKITTIIQSTIGKTEASAHELESLLTQLSKKYKDTYGISIM